jgi:hypothetical protein
MRVPLDGGCFQETLHTVAFEGRATGRLAGSVGGVDYGAWEP